MKSQKAVILLLSLSFCVYSVAQPVKNTLEEASIYERVAQLNKQSKEVPLDSVDRRIDLMLKALDEIKKQSNLDSTMTQIELIIDYLTQIGRYNQVVDYGKLGFEMAKKGNRMESMARFSRLTGNGFFFSGVLDKAIEAYTESLAYAEKSKSSSQIGGSLNNIGIILLRQKKFDEALEYFNRAQEAYSRTNEKVNQAKAINNIGNIYFYKGDYERALKSYLASLELSEQSNNLNQKSINTHNISAIHNVRGETDLAIHYGKLATQYALEDKDFWNIVVHSLSLGNILLSQKGDTSEARKYIEMGHSYALKANSVTLLKDSYLSLRSLYEQTGRLDSAYKYLKHEYEIADSINRMDTQKKLADFESKQEIVLKEKENKLVWRYLMYISILSVLIVITILFNLKIKAQANNKLSEMNAEIKSKNAKLVEMNATKNKFFSIIAHDLKNPLTTFIGYTELIKERLATSPKEQTEKSLDQVNKLATKMYSLLENLLKWSRSELGVIEFNPEEVNIEEIINEAQEIYALYSKSKDISIEKRMCKNNICIADRNMLSTVIRNLLNNAIKFSPHGDKIVIETMDSNGFITLLVKDNGFGISEDDQKRLFKIDSGFTRHGTDNELGTGLGLILCKEFVERNGGKMIVESEPYKGSSIGFTVPSV